MLSRAWAWAQVEHGITEMVSGVDLVAWQLELQGRWALQAVGVLEELIIGQ
jgi:pyruvate carboxylase